MSSDSLSSSEFPAVERRRGERRPLENQRKCSPPAKIESCNAPQRRPRGERRRQVDPATCEKDYSDEEILFIRAMDQYKRCNRRPFPTWSEVLEVLHALGYRKTEEATALPGLPASVEKYT